MNKIKFYNDELMNINDEIGNYKLCRVFYMLCGYAQKRMDW